MHPPATPDVDPSIAALARAQATSLMFDRLGPYKDNVSGLLAAITAGFALEATQGSHAVEAELQRLFSAPNGAQVSALFAPHQLSDLPRLFTELCSRLQTKLARAMSPPEDSKVLYLGSMPGAPLLVAVVRTKTEVRVSVCDPHDTPENNLGMPQLVASIQAPKKQLAVQLSNTRFGEPVLMAYPTPDGFYLDPVAPSLRITPGIPPSGALAKLDGKLHTRGQPRPENQAYIDTTRY